jgi:CRP/FNR family transcriptional regulator
MVKVYSQYDDKELLLYYIKPKQSCIISFAAATYNQPSKIFAITEEDSKILLLPTNKIGEWIFRFPRFSQLFFDLYNQRYLDLLDTINQLVFQALDQRILSYLIEKSELLDSDIIKITHRLIANDLGTAREVVTRVVKKLEKEQKIIQTADGIKILV